MTKRGKIIFVLWILLWLIVGFFVGDTVSGQPSSIEDKLNHLFLRISELEQSIIRLQNDAEFRPCIESTGRLETILLEEGETVNDLR